MSDKEKQNRKKVIIILGTIIVVIISYLLLTSGIMQQTTTGDPQYDTYQVDNAYFTVPKNYTQIYYKELPYKDNSGNISVEIAFKTPYGANNVSIITVPDFSYLQDNSDKRIIEVNGVKGYYQRSNKYHMFSYFVNYKEITYRTVDSNYMQIFENIYYMGAVNNTK